MDWQKNRLFIAGLLLIALGGLAIWAWGARTGDTPVRPEQRAGNFPDLSRDDIAAIEITRAEGDRQTIHLERRDEGTWVIAQPIEVPADASAVSTALDKLDELAVAGIAASNPQFHERLEVDPEHGVRVIARNAAGDALADLWIGAFRSGNTMVRLEGEDRVVSVRGSIKFAFNKELRDWRDRTILNLEADDVREVAWAGPNGTFRFTRAEAPPAAPPEGEAAEGEGAEGAAPSLGEWQPAEISYLPPPAEAPAEGTPARRQPPPAPPQPLTAIEGFQASKVRSMIASLARMRASDFAAPDVTPEAAGIGPQSPRVTLTVPPAEGQEGPQTHSVILGNEVSADRHDFYAQREGEPTIYIISTFLGQRVNPTATSFTESAPAAPSDPHGAGGEALPLGGAEGAQLPPEVMEQIRRQLEQQGLGGGAGP